MSSSENIFIKPKEYYKRDINPINQYIEQSSFYLSKMLSKPFETIKQNFVDKIKKGIIKLKDPIVHHFERDEFGDKQKTETKLNTYINKVVKNNNLIAPTFTVLLSSEEKPSLIAAFSEENVAKRNIVKKQAQQAKAAGDTLTYILKDIEQTDCKANNNSISGACVSEGSILNNPSAHSVLTSTTRTVSSLSNAVNEKIISGNRHYFNPNITLYNIISIVYNTNKNELNDIIVKYNLKYPTVEDVVDCVKYSSDLYWSDEEFFKKIYDFICKLNEVERASIVYTLDLYHVRKHNSEFVRIFLSKLSKKVINKEYDDPLAIIKSNNESTINLVHQICVKEVKGIGKNYSSLNKEQLNILAATADNIINTILEYKDFIDVIFLSNNSPASTANLPHMVRRCVVTSDTDSTLFSTDEYVKWYFGDYVFTDESFALASTIAFISTQCIAHVLAMLSANMGVSKDKLFVLSMKPEYSFPVFIPTSVAKHYYTFKTIQEGNVFKKPEIEIKGVHLKNSALPKHIVTEMGEKMERILFSIYNNEKVSLKDEINIVLDKERSIMESITNGETTYLKQCNINSPEGYKLSEDKSPYQHHNLWVEVFEPKYGVIEKPQYTALKIPTILNNKTAIKKWLESIEDKDFSNRMCSWLLKGNKTQLNTILMNLSFIRAYGMPEELKSIINTEKIILEMTNGDRMILETLGYFPKDKLILSKTM